MLKILPLLVYLGLVIYALSDMWQRSDHERFATSRWVWAAIIVLLPFIGALLWIVLSFMRRADGGGARDKRPVAPDDDPEYLAWLRDQARRKRQQP